MLVIRPATMDDIPQLLALTHMTGFGLTTLPRDRALLERRLRNSQRGFAKSEDDTPQGESYLFVMEDIDAQCVVGTCGMMSKVGGFEPFYAYRIETAIHESKMLNVRKEVRTLNLVMEHDGPCEIGSLFLHPSYRDSGNGRTLSLARFLYMADRPSLFDPVVIAELRGVIDQHGRSAFWEALGKHFFDLELPTADYLSVVDKRFIGDLMPRHPIYIPLLPPEAQAVIGKVHDETAPALHLLESEGFAFSGMVDIFEAGPIVRCARDRIRTVHDSRLALVARVVKTIDNDIPYLASNVRQNFRACQTRLHLPPIGGIEITEETAAALGVSAGDTVRYIPLRSRQTSGDGRKHDTTTTTPPPAHLHPHHTTATP